MPYESGANLGGWLVQENWLLPNVLLLRLGPADIRDNQEWDYIQRMCQRGIDAVGSMRRHWASYLGEDDSYDLLTASEPPPMLRRLRSAGVTRLRIPVGYWAFEPPVLPGCVGQLQADASESPGQPAVPGDGAPSPPPAFSSAGPVLRSLSSAGLTSDGFVTGSALYLAALLRLLQPLGMRCVIDMHSLPGGSVKHMGYTGRYFDEARAFDGARAWYEASRNVSSSGTTGAKTGNGLGPGPSKAHPFLKRTVAALDTLAALVAELDAAPETAGVVAAVAPWNEALFMDNVKAAEELPVFTLAMVPRIRKRLPEDRFDIYLNFFNDALDWPAWLSANQEVLGGGIVAEVHIYHAFDPPAPDRCGMCVGGEAGMRSVLCQICGSDATMLQRYRSAGLRTVVGEWSLSTCGMWGNHPSQISGADFLYAWHASAKSSFAAHGVEADYFWSAAVRTGGYDPTLYAPHGRASRAAVLSDLEDVSQRSLWQAANVYFAPPDVPVPADYLLNWDYARLTETMTSGGFPVVLPGLHLGHGDAHGNGGGVVGGGAGAAGGGRAAGSIQSATAPGAFAKIPRLLPDMSPPLRDEPPGQSPRPRGTAWGDRLSAGTTATASTWARDHDEVAAPLGGLDRGVTPPQPRLHSQPHAPGFPFSFQPHSLTSLGDQGSQTSAVDLPSSLLVLGSCSFHPPVPASVAKVADGACGLCDGLPQALAFWAAAYPGAVAAILLTLLAVACCCWQVLLSRERPRWPRHGGAGAAQAGGTNGGRAAGGGGFNAQRGWLSRAAAAAAAFFRRGRSSRVRFLEQPLLIEPSPDSQRHDSPLPPGGAGATAGAPVHG